MTAFVALLRSVNVGGRRKTRRQVPLGGRDPAPVRAQVDS